MNRRQLLCVAGLSLPVASAMAQSPAPDPLDTLQDIDRSAFRTIIRAQMDAFLADDAERAFSYASPGIQTRFGNAINFLASVAAAYQPVYRPQAVLFQEVIAVAGQPAQQVLVQAPDGSTVMAVYPMERQSDGSWRIDGCFLSRSEAQML